MDKRSILFVITASLALFAVNYYFDMQRQETLKEWTKQQEAKQAKKQKDLEAEITQRTAKLSDLPLVDLYADAEEKQFLLKGATSGKDVITLKGHAELPETVYVQKKAYQRIYTPKDGLEGPVVYSSEGKAALPVAELPDFGHYDLQAVTFDQNPQIYLGDYTDGHFSIPAEKLHDIKRAQAGPEGKVPSLQVGNALLFVKVKDQYFPTAAYLKQEKSALYLDEIVDFPYEAVALIQGEVATAKAVKPAEKYYVLQNSYQQLVFSNYGGALAEINLPFQTQEDKLSAVREIEFDRDMVAQNPQNAHFPAHAYFTPGATVKDMVAHSEGQLGGYYPLIRRDLIEKANRKSYHIPPRLYALNIVSEYPEVAELVYEVTEFTPTKIVFEGTQSIRKITKTFEIVEPPQGGPYCLNLTLKIDGDGRGLWLTSGVPEVEWISGSPAPALKYRITRQNKPEVIQLDLPKDAVSISSIKPDWICNSNGFLGLIMDPKAGEVAGFRAQYISGATAPTRLLLIDQNYQRFEAANLPGYILTMPLNSAGGVMNYRIFSGPFADGILKQVDAIYADASTGYTPDYIAAISFHGWFSFISEPFAKFLFVIMNFFHSWTDSWGFSIILLTVFLRLMLYPLNAWSIKSSVKMQQISPEVAAIQERYKKDPKKAQLEVVNLYRERGINPMSGCFPLLIQMPFLIGMFDLLKSTFELRGASFIPGWIDNLTSPDVLFSWSQPIFFIGNQFHLLPILLGLVMFIQQRLMSPMSTDQSTWTEQQRQQRAMGNIMTVVFAFMFYNFPSGLNIYWLSSMLLGIIQQAWSARRIKAQLAKNDKTQVPTVKPSGGKR